MGYQVRVLSQKSNQGKTLQNQSQVSSPCITKMQTNSMAIVPGAVINPYSLTLADVMQLQRTIGNESAGRLLEASRADAGQLQRAATLNSPPNQSVAQQTEAPATIQGKIGFEAELRVPSFGDQKRGTATFWESENNEDQKASEKVKKFVQGGLGYDTEIGGSLKADPFYQVTTDHDSDVGRGEIIEELKDKGYIEEAKLKDTTSNIEYVTPALDELAEGSNKKFEDQANRLKAHMDDTVNKAKSRKMEQLQAPAKAGYYTGIPEEDFRDWLSKKHFRKLQPLIDDFVNNEIQDQVYLQATVGIIPSAMSDLHHQALEKSREGDLNASAVEEDVLQKVEETVTALFNEDDFKNHKTIDEMGPAGLDALRGIIHILFMYIVGDTITQTSAGTKSTVKNAVPFLIKMSTANILAETGTSALRENKLPKDLIEIIANYLQSSKYATVQYWTGDGENTYQGEGGKQQEPRDYDKLITKGTYADFVTRALGGEPPPKVSVIVGKKTLEKPDPLPDRVDDVKVKWESYGQAGIPVEYRWIKVNPTTAGMLGEMKKIIEEVRNLNTKHLNKEQKDKIKDKF